MQSALNVCEDFLKELGKLKLTYTADDDERRYLREALHRVHEYCKSLEQALRGSDDPEVPHD